MKKLFVLLCCFLALNAAHQAPEPEDERKAKRLCTDIVAAETDPEEELKPLWWTNFLNQPIPDASILSQLGDPKCLSLKCQSIKQLAHHITQSKLAAEKIMLALPEDDLRLLLAYFLQKALNNYIEHREIPRIVKFATSSDGTVLAYMPESGSVYVEDFKTKKKLMNIIRASKGTQIILSPDGSTIVLCKPKTTARAEKQFTCSLYQVKMGAKPYQEIEVILPEDRIFGYTGDRFWYFTVRNSFNTDDLAIERLETAMKKNKDFWDCDRRNHLLVSEPQMPSYIPPNKIITLSHEGDTLTGLTTYNLDLFCTTVGGLLEVFAKRATNQLSSQQTQP